MRDPVEVTREIQERLERCGYADPCPDSDLLDAREDLRALLEMQRVIAEANMALAAVIRRQSDLLRKASVEFGAVCRKMIEQSSVSLLAHDVSVAALRPKDGGDDGA